MKRLTLPASREAIRELSAGDMVLLDGEITITAGLPTMQSEKCRMRPGISGLKRVEVVGFI